MAGAEALISRIVQETEEQEREIKAKAEQEAAKILEKAKSEAKEVAASIEAKAKAKAEENRRRAFTMAELESRKETLTEKQRQIDNAFAGAVQKISSIDAEDYHKIVIKMLVESVETGEEIVYISPRDKDRLTEEFIAKANEALKKLGKKGELSLAVDSVDFGGGIILKSEEYTLNNSFNSIIKMQRDELEPEVAEILFQ
jgi:V/A-type H+/Na+-transporting ATPase subunit E